MLVEFASVVDAVRCAVAVQQAMAGRNPDFRCWTPHRAAHRHQFRRRDCEGDDLYGDGINIAARIEDLADAGGVFISYTGFTTAICRVRFSRAIDSRRNPIRSNRAAVGPGA
jgi:class 3 adenylate cyclase